MRFELLQDYTRREQTEELLKAVAELQHLVDVLPLKGAEDVKKSAEAVAHLLSDLQGHWQNYCHCAMQCQSFLVR